MKALVLSGGKGVRLRPFTYIMPKQLVPVANTPIISFVIGNIIKAGITDIGVIVTPQNRKKIEATILQSYADKADFTFIVQENPLGLAHAVKVARHFLEGEDFIMYLGDNLIGAEIGKFIQIYQEKEYDAFILLKKVKDPSIFGVAKIEGGRIIKLVEKPKEFISDLALVGIYIFSSQIIDAADNIKPSARGELEITDAISYLLKKGRKVGFHLLDKWWIDTGKKDDLLNANRLVLGQFVVEKKEAQIKDSDISGKVNLANSAIVVKSKLNGPLVVGNNCYVENSSVGPDVSIGDECTIKNSYLNNCVLMKGVTVENINLKDSIIGNNVKVANKSGNNRHYFKFSLSDDSQMVIEQ